MSTTEQTVPQVSVESPRGRSVDPVRVLITIGVLAAIAVFAFLFYRQSFTVLTDRYSTDIAQIAQNMANGSGYTTRFVRPFNAALIEGTDALPEVNHGPLFPAAVAAGFKARGSSDQVAAWASLGFLLLTIAATYLLGRLLFERRTGLLSAAVVGVSAPVLQAGTSGQEWTMAAFWFVLLLLAVAKHHKASQGLPRFRDAIWPALSGLLIGLLFMTYHVLLFLVLPVALYYAFTGQARKLHLAVFLVAAAVCVTPWAFRNAELTGGSILGANAWDVMTDTRAFPGDIFFRTTDEANRGIARVVLFPQERFTSFAEKLMRGSGNVLTGLASVLGLVMLGFAAVSMLYRFRAPTANAVRGMLYVAVPLLVATFALFSASPHCVVLFAPAAAVFGSAYFLLLLDAKKLHVFYGRVLIGGLVLVTAWPALSAIAWKGGQPAPVDPATRCFASIGSRLSKMLVFTDVPWIAAYRTGAFAVWLPRTDADVDNLSGKGIDMVTVLLTAESSRYRPDEAWYLLHQYKFWRDYSENQQACIKDCIDQAAKEIMMSPQISERLKGDTLGWAKKEVPRTLDARKRACVLTQALQGYKQQPVPQAPVIKGSAIPEDSPWPDDIIYLTRQQTSHE